MTSPGRYQGGIRQYGQRRVIKSVSALRTRIQAVIEARGDYTENLNLECSEVQNKYRSRL